MWYLYMLIGLYLITPIIKPFVVKASDRDWLAALGLLFVLSSLFPTLNAMGAGLRGYMFFSTPYLFIYLLGGTGYVGKHRKKFMETKYF